MHPWQCVFVHVSHGELERASRALSEGGLGGLQGGMMGKSGSELLFCDTPLCF